MKALRLFTIVIILALVLPMVGCDLIGQNPLTALGSLVPQATVEGTVEATVDAGEATAESTPLIRPKTTAATAKPKTVATDKPKATIAKTVVATIKPKATVKATATKKSTVAPTKVPSSNGSSSLPVGTSLFSDDFSDPASGWAEGSNDLSEWGYLNSKYVITVHATKNLAWSFASQSFSDFVVEVTAAKVSGPADGEYGVLFRLLDNQNFYMFEVNATGSYFAAAYVNAEWVILIPWTKSTAIKTGAASNKLAVVAQGGTFGLYINGIKVDEFTDSTFTEGDVALLAGAQAVGELTAGFTNIDVWEVGGGASPTVEAIGSISKGAKLYSETFAEDTTGWDTWDSANSVVGYEGGKYSIKVLNTDQLSWGNAYQSFDDFVIEVDAAKVAGLDDSGFGIVLRYTDPDNFYYFVVTSNGQYRFSYYLDNKRTDIIPLTASDTVKLGNLSNKLGVACKGNHFILSINGTVVEDLSDDTFSSGDIGLLAISSLTEAGTKVTFDNLNVWAVK